MEIKASNQNGEIKATFDFLKEETEKRQDFVYAISTMLACITGEVVDKLEPYRIEGRKDCALSLLEAVKMMVSDYYDNLVEKTSPEEKQKLAKAGMYAFMEEQYDAFLKANHLNEEDLLNRIQTQEPAFRVSEKDGSYHFELTAADGTNILDAGVVSRQADRHDIETQAMVAAVVSMVLLDKAFGEEDPRNIARAKGNIKFFLDMIG